jgi:hypothetical protein
MWYLCNAKMADCVKIERYCIYFWPTEIRCAKFSVVKISPSLADGKLLEMGLQVVLMESFVVGGNLCNY